MASRTPATLWLDRLSAMDDVAGTQGGAEKLLHVGEEAGAIDGSVEDQRGGHSVAAQGGDERGGFPVPVGGRSQATFPPEAPGLGLGSWRCGPRSRR